MFNNSIEPRMLLGRNLRGIVPELGNELVLVHELIFIEARVACLWPKDTIGRDVIVNRARVLPEKRIYSRSIYRGDST
jgi:hypothetical protein